MEPVVISDELTQNIFLRITTSKISQRKNRQQLIAEHKRLLEYYNYNGYQDIILNIRRQSESTLNLKLQLRISIVDLQVDNVPTGRFLLCRVIVKWVKLNALITVVEDPEGNVERLILYEMILRSDITKKNESSLPFTDEFLPIGTQLAIKDPSYIIASDGNTIIRSDNPKDVIVIDHVNKEFSDLKWSTDLKVKDIFKRSIDDFRRCGNNYFVLNDYKTAIDEYSGGIKLEPQNVTLLINRAAAYLELRQFDKALADVEIALNYEPDNIKAAYRKVKALCGLKRYQEALIIIRDLHRKVKVNNNNKSFKQCTEQLLKHVEMLVSENENGKYDYLRIINEYNERAKIREDGKGWVCKGGPRLDHAEFLNDDIEIRPVEGKGRGWIAKRNIPENTLLMVSKAFKIVFSGNEHDHRAEELVTRLAADLDRYQELCQLYCGPDPEKLLNRTHKVSKFSKYNAFSTYDSIIELGSNNRIFGSGLWILPSYFNHSCVDENIFHYLVGDLMFLRTLRPISKGEELIMSYSLSFSDYNERSRYLKSINIDCQCRLCKLDKSESQGTKLRRAQLLETYEKSIKPKLLSNVSPSLIKELKETIAELRRLRKEHPDLEFDSMQLIKDLAIAYRKSSNPIDITIIKEAYDFSKKFRWISHSIDISKSIFLFYFKHVELRELMKWYEISLKELIEPIRGKFKASETNWRNESMLLTEVLFPENNPFAFGVAVAKSPV